MAPCCGPNATCFAPLAAPPVVLLQIRKGYAASWAGLEISIEAESQDWALEVRDASTRRTLYTARRSNAQAARIAALEFAVFRVFGGTAATSPERLARELSWREFW